MPIKEKRFISKKNSVTYRLVPRCQVDPDTNSTECVLVPVNEVKHEQFSTKLPASALPPPVKETAELKKQIRAEGPQPDWDPDVVAALDDNFSHEDVESVLEDDFIALANRPVDELLASNEFENSSENEDFDEGSLFSDDEDVEGKAVKYSLTSGVANCPEDVQILNERFERLCKTYQDDDIGSLDFNNIEGCLAPNEESEDFVDFGKKLFPYEGDLDKDLKSKTLLFAESDDDDDNKESESEEEVTEELPKYDCESIISTYSTTQNLPAVIKMERKEKPAKIPTNLWKKNLTKSSLKKIGRAEEEEDMEYDNESVLSSCIRCKDETPEEKRQRKKAVKQMRRESRVAKKENKLAFKEEEKRRKAIALNINRSKVIPLVC